MLNTNHTLSDFCQDDVDAVLETEIALAKTHYHQHTAPKAVLLAGQPGSGKTELSTMMIARMDSDAVFINGDEYRRYHPNYRALYDTFGSDSIPMTSGFSSAITEQLIEQLSDLHMNLIIEGTGRTAEVPRKTAKLLVEKGYSVEMAVIAARPEISLISTLLRFYMMNEKGTIPRATAVEAHDNVVSALPYNLDDLIADSCISHMGIWDRELSLVYDSDRDQSQPSERLLAYWHRPWLDTELAYASEQITLLREKERRTNLGQSKAIDTIEQRVIAAQSR